MTLKKVVLVVFFAALLATPLIIQRLTAENHVVQPQGDPVFGFKFQEVAAEAGIDFRNRSPTLDAKLANIMPIIASMGAGVSVVDFDRDGWNDLYLTNSGEGSKNALYRNNRDGTFSDFAEQLGVADVNKPGDGVSMGSVWGDFDSDGFEDLFLYKWGRPTLFRNDGGRGFTPVENAGFPNWVNANTAVWFDFDRDGRLDIFLGGYFREDLDLWNLSTTAIMPESFEYAKNGGRKFLFRNLGGGKFEEVSKQAGIDSNRWSLAAVAADLDKNGFPDLFVANDYGVSELYLNDGSKFIESGERTGVGFAPKSGMSASVGDILNNGRFSIYVSNISEPGILLQGNNLWIQNGSGELRFENHAGGFGVELGGWSWGSQFGDLNNDGYQDIFLTNGYISSDEPASYWYDYSKITVGNNNIIGDAKNWAPIGSKSLAGRQEKKVWVNDGAGRFDEVAQVAGLRETFDGRAVAFADLWNRGVLDVIVATQNGPVLVYRNSVSQHNNWISIELDSTKTRSPIGAAITVFWNGQQQVQQIDGGSGFASQNQRRVHFGFGSSRPEKIEIRWPSGEVQVIDYPEVNKIHKFVEP